MNLNFWQTFNEAVAINKGRESVIIPAFSITNVPWLGASFILTEFLAESEKNFSIKTDLASQVNSTFVLAVRYVVGDVVTRYKLWSGIGEVLAAPDYNGERLLADSVFEIWSVEAATDPYDIILTAPLLLPSSRLIPTVTCGTSPSTSRTLTQDPLIFDELPMPLPTEFPLAWSG